MGWHIIKRLLQAVPVLLVTLSRIEFKRQNTEDRRQNTESRYAIHYPLYANL